MTFTVDFVTARRLDDVAVHRPQGGNKRLQSLFFMRHGTGSPQFLGNLAMAFTVDFVTARRLTADVAVHTLTVS
jgi:hypothetical protein